MKIKKLLTVVSALFVMGTSAFAFEGSRFWREYGAGLKDGDGIFSVGVGVGFDLFALPVVYSTYNGVFYLPYVETSYEKMVHINDMLPFSFGGYGGFDFLTFKDGSDVTIFNSSFHVGALAKYHFNFDVENMDVYAGLKVGLNGNIYNGYNSSVNPFTLGFDHGEIIGVQWIWGGFGIALETGFPYWLNFKLSFKM